MMMKSVYRNWQGFLCLSSAFVLAASCYFQWVKGLEPCPLCLMQRVCVGLLFAMSLLALMMGGKRARGMLLTQALLAGSGLYFAARQLWLQSLPADQMPACMPTLEILLRYFPWRDIVHALFLGAADCGKITWQWLGLSMPAWSALYFAAVLFATGMTRFLLNRTL